MRKQNIVIMIALSLVLIGAACGRATQPTVTDAKPAESKPEISKTNEDISRQPTNATTTAAAADLSGNYAVSGAGLDGKPYRGEMIVTRHDDVYQLSWKVGNERYDGVGVQSGNTVAAAYTTGKDGTGCGAVVYKIGAGNSLEGKWGEWGVNQNGTERATPAGQLNGNTGVFDVSGTNANGSSYKGKLTITKDANDVYQFAWDTGTKFVGTGVKLGDYLAAGSGAKQCGFVIYEVKNGNLEGKWGIPGTTSLGTEQAMKK